MSLGDDTRREFDRDELRAEYEQMLGSWEHAFAFGHGCSLGDHPVFQSYRRRLADVRARLAEFEA